MSHRGSILLLPSGIYAWNEQDFAPVLAERDAVDLLLLGTGRDMVRPPRSVRDSFERSGIQLDFMATAFALSTYNLLLAEGRKVAAALTAVAETG